ncbi:MAG: amidohydrolase [Desulfuromusa sp.]|jgi:amidohydrolase|nr:amidohydrolase [Desulfuromusa sp.]
MQDILRRIEDLYDELVAIRRDLHMYPELGFEEQRTAGVIEKYLRKLGLETQRMTKTGVVALIEGSQPGPVLMLRADMDALPMEEENDITYKSRNPGVMHACGHDAHVAMLLIAAKILVEKRDQIKGTIKLVFQPNEEVAGAIHMINDGVLESPKVDAVMGQHIWSFMESGKIGIASGPIMSGLDVFKIRVIGKGGHTGAPENSIDPVLCAANVIQSVQMLQTREISNLNSTVIMFGKISGGTKGSIIPDEIEMEGTIRFLYKGGPDSEEQPTERFIRIVRGICTTHRCECEIAIEHENIPLINDEEMSDLAYQAAQMVFPSTRAIEINRSLASEDFSEFTDRVPGVFIFLGTANPEAGSDYAHHNNCFNIDEPTMKQGVAMHVLGALNFFEHAETLSFIKNLEQKQD